jgi:hypothetical protein
MGICCCKDKEELFDSEQLIRTFDTMSSSDSSTTPFYIFPDGRKKEVIKYNRFVSSPHSY